MASTLRDGERSGWWRLPRDWVATAALVALMSTRRDWTAEALGASPASLLQG